jgi:chromosome segregation ATPase
MRRPVVSQEELFETANRLQAEGKEVTAPALLTALGGGSLTTIYKHLAVWKESRPAATKATSSNEIPDTVQNAFATAWRFVATEGAREVAAAKEKAQEDVKVAQKEFAEALLAIERLEAESESEANKIAALESRVSELESALQKAGNDNAALEATVEQLKQRVMAQDIEFARVHKDMESERQSHREELDRAAEKHAVAQEKSHAEIERLRGQLDETRKQFEQSERKCSEAESKINEAQNRTRVAEEHQAQALKERDDAIKESSALQGQVNSLKSQNEDLLSRLTADKKKG